MTLEEKFTAQLQTHLQKAEILGIPQPKRLLQACAQYGSVEAISQLLRRHRLTECFDALADAGRLELAPETLVVSKEFGPLFSDEEADFCLQVLLDAGFYG